MRAIGDIVKQMKRELSPRRRRVIAAAYHEAGHAVAALLLGDEVLEVRINARAVMAGKADMARMGRYVG
jgi:ATP-dependent Zn protease